MKNFLLISLLLLANFTCKASDTKYFEEQELNNFFECLYSFNFSKADSCIQNTKYSQNCYKHFMQLNLSWWQLVTTNEQLYVTNALVSVLKGLDCIKFAKLPESEKLFLRLCFESYRLRLLLFNKQVWRAYSQSKNLAAIAYGSLGNEKQIKQFALTTGLFHYFGALGKNKYPLLFKDNIYKNTSKDSGFYYLYDAQTSDKIFIKTEARYFLLKIFFEIEEKPQNAIVYSSTLVNTYSENTIFRYYHLAGLLDTGNNNEAKLFYAESLKQIIQNNSLTASQKQHLTKITKKLYNKKQ